MGQWGSWSIGQSSGQMVGRRGSGAVGQLVDWSVERTDGPSMGQWGSGAVGRLVSRAWFCTTYPFSTTNANTPLRNQQIHYPRTHRHREYCENLSSGRFRSSSVKQGVERREPDGLFRSVPERSDAESVYTRGRRRATF
eukprot:4910551-Pyramimonas_sp.AAC.1